MPPGLLEALREQIEDHFLRCDNISFIRKATSVSISQISKIRKFWEETDLVTPVKGLRDPLRLITPHMEEDLLKWLEQRPLSYLDKMAYFLFNKYNIVVSESTISKCLKRIGWTRKKVDLSCFILQYYIY